MARDHGILAASSIHADIFFIAECENECEKSRFQLLYSIEAEKKNRNKHTKGSTHNRTVFAIIPHWKPDIHIEKYFE